MNRNAVKVTACCLLTAAAVNGNTMMTEASTTAGVSDLTSIAMNNETEGSLPVAGVSSTLLQNVNEKATAADTSSEETATAEDANVAETQTDAVTSQYADLAIAKVNDYVNIRSTASEDGEILGKLYTKGAATVLGTEGDWTQIQSGSVTGYVKTEYLTVGDQAAIDEAGTKVATVATTTLNVREKASEGAGIVYQVAEGQSMKVLKEKGGWVKVATDEGKGWISTQYASVDTKFENAESKEEEAARLEKEAAEAAAEEAAQAQEEESTDSTANNTTSSNSNSTSSSNKTSSKSETKTEKKSSASKSQTKTSSSSSTAKTETKTESTSSDSSKSEEKTESKSEESTSTSSSKSGQAVASYACQFIGNPYKWGGTSLTNGADCSGFVMSVYKHFGVSLPHSSSAQRSVGKKVSYSDMQVGDIVCYSGHVGIYAGGGKIVNASTKATGIKYTDVNYSKIITIRRIFN